MNPSSAAVNSRPSAVREPLGPRTKISGTPRAHLRLRKARREAASHLDHKLVDHKAIANHKLIAAAFKDRPPKARMPMDGSALGIAALAQRPGSRRCSRSLAQARTQAPPPAGHSIVVIRPRRKAGSASPVPMDLPQLRRTAAMLRHPAAPGRHWI